MKTQQKWKKAPPAAPNRKSGHEEEHVTQRFSRGETRFFLR
jgi:hypothetical protein